MGQVTGISQQQQATDIANAASKYNIPATILLGVYGAESSFGSNTGDATYRGPFAFGPPAASQYGYPYVASPTAAQFAQQADAAAHMLSDLYKSHGNNWDQAFRAYSGEPLTGALVYGGYGEAHIQDMVKAAGVTWLMDLQSAGASGITGNNPVTNNPVTNAISSVTSGVGNIAGLVTSLDFWKRLGEVIAGLILVAMGLRSLTGGSVDPIAVVSDAAGKVRAA